MIYLLLIIHLIISAPLPLMPLQGYLGLPARIVRDLPLLLCPPADAPAALQPLPPGRLRPSCHRTAYFSCRRWRDPEGRLRPKVPGHRCAARRGRRYQQMRRHLIWLRQSASHARDKGRHGTHPSRSSWPTPALAKPPCLAPHCQSVCIEHSVCLEG